MGPVDEAGAPSEVPPSQGKGETEGKLQMSAFLVPQAGHGHPGNAGTSLDTGCLTQSSAQAPVTRGLGEGDWLFQCCQTFWK